MKREWWGEWLRQSGMRRHRMMWTKCLGELVGKWTAKEWTRCFGGDGLESCRGLMLKLETVGRKIEDDHNWIRS